MLFNSFEFIFGFLPAVIVLVYLLHHFNRGNLVVYLLATASIFFYGWWNWHLVWLLLASVLGNYLIGRRLSHQPSSAESRRA